MTRLALTLIAIPLSVSLSISQSVSLAAAVDVPRIGPADAKVEITLFGDFASADAASAFAVVDAYMRATPVDVALTFRHLPKPDDHVAAMAHRAAAAAAAQDRFWELTRLAFANQERLGLGDVLLMARQAGIADEARLVFDTHDAATEQRLSSDRQEAARQGVTGDVAVLVNGRRLAGRVTRRSLTAAVAAALQAR